MFGLVKFGVNVNVMGDERWRDNKVNCNKVLGM